ncbi:MAG: fasciclin domain-containing protein, partial [Anaerolineales bacterium]
MATRTDTYLDRGNFLTRFLGRRAGGRRINIQDTITYIYLIFGTLVMFGPVVWLVMSSFKDESLLFEENPTFLPYRQETLQIQHVELLRHAPGFYDIRVGSGHIVESDVEATNGTIHLVDNLMLPPGAREAINALDTSAYEDGDLPSEPRREALEADTGTLMTTLLDERDYLRMAGLFQQTGLDTPLAEEGPFTLLLPSEGALRNFGRQNGTDTLAALLAPENSDLLADILRYHIVRGDFSLEDLFAARGEQVTTLRDDQTLTIRVDDGREMPLFDVTFNRLTTNGALLQHVNLQASNGVAHIIDDVLLTDDLATQLAALDTSGVDPLDRPEARDNVVTPESEGPLPQIVAGQPSLSLLDRMLANTELPDMLADDDARYTMLAPSDAAWLGFADTQGEATLAALFQPENGALLADLLRLHVLDGR